MECGDFNNDWIIIENGIGQCLQDLKRGSLIKYLTDTITPFTYEDMLKNKEEEFLRDFGDIEELKKMFEEGLEKFGPQGPFKSFEQYKHYYIDNHRDTFFYYAYSKDDVYNYTSQKYAIEILASYSQFRQVAFIPEHEIEGNQYPDIEVNFIDKDNVGRFQVHFKMEDKTLPPDFFNTKPIKFIEKCDKVPILSLEKFKSLLPLSMPIKYYFSSKYAKEPIFGVSFHDKFHDSKGNEKSITLHDCQYVLMNIDSQPFRCIPILDIIKPQLEKMDFSQGKWSDLTNFYYDSGLKTLPRKYDQERKEIQFQLCACDRSAITFEDYTVFDIDLKLNKELEVEILENKNKRFIIDTRYSEDRGY